MVVTASWDKTLKYWPLNTLGQGTPAATVNLSERECVSRVRVLSYGDVGAGASPHHRRVTDEKMQFLSELAALMPKPQQHAPAIGEDGPAILRDLGYATAEIDAIFARGGVRAPAPAVKAAE